MKHSGQFAILLTASALAGCSSDSDEGTGGEVAALACDAEPVVMTTPAGVEFVRTPDACFDSLPDWSFAPKYVELDGLRQAYVEEGPANGPVVLLLHGQPSWSYLYRKMIPVLADAGYRVIAMDHLGMGRSDKPLDISAYSYLGHNDRLERFIEALDLRDINMFVQDWGSVIGLRVAGLNLDRFARIAVGDGALPVFPAGAQPFAPVENPDEMVDIDSAFAQIPAQQVPFYDGCTLLADPGGGFFGDWMEYAMKASSFRASEVVEAMTWFDLPADVEAAYDAPFPSRIYMAGPRTFPSLINEVPGTTDDAWVRLSAFERPFLTLWAANDPGNLGSCETQYNLMLSVAGSTGMPHDRLPEASHFLQDDQGALIATRLVDFFATDALRFDLSGRYCEVLLVNRSGNDIEAEVWGTQNLNECPAASWEALDTDTIQTETGALGVVLNGPRVGLMTRAVITGGPRSLERQTFGDLPMRYIAAVQVDPSQLQTRTSSYTESTVRRTSRFTFAQGTEVYELTAPDGATYVMQSMSLIVDPNLTVGDLAGLGSRLAPPDGWTYQARTLDADLVLQAEGEATVLQDELQNTYQRTAPAMMSQDPTLPVLANGTGTACTSDADCASLDASTCLSGGDTGYCTVEGCTASACGAPYVCCFGCSPQAAALLPFEGSACIPAAAATQLANAAGCTCE